MINLHESMGPGRDRTHDPWISSQTSICSQTPYRLRYAAGRSKLLAKVISRRQKSLLARKELNENGRWLHAQFKSWSKPQKMNFKKLLNGFSTLISKVLQLIHVESQHFVTATF